MAENEAEKIVTETETENDKKLHSPEYKNPVQIRTFLSNQFFLKKLYFHF
jgi:hypothetical protein